MHVLSNCVSACDVRASVIQESKTWIGTRFKLHGRLKRDRLNPRGGCDCVGLIIGVAKKLNLRSGNALYTTSEQLYNFDSTNYAFVQNGEVLYEALSLHMVEICLEDMKAGDVVLFSNFGNSNHVGILIESGYVIHCTYATRSVVMQRLDCVLKLRSMNLHSAFSFYDIYVME